MSYLQNAWYVAALSQELMPGALMSRTLLGQPVVLFRSEDGTPSALFDRCPHRFAPLSMGKVLGSNLQCPYHGLTFGPDGSCVQNPYGTAPKAAKARSFPAIERHRAIWVWMGEQAVADPDLVPDLSFLGNSPETAFSAGYMHTRAGYEILIDNIMDLTHTEYLHADSLAGNGVVHKVRPVTREVDGKIEVSWFSPDDALPPFHREILVQERADLLTRVTWEAPSTMTLVAAAIPSGKTESEGYLHLNAHMVTPESENTSHYFFAATRNYRLDDAKLNEFVAQARERIFRNEDKPVVEMVQVRMGEADFWDLRPLLLGADEAAVRVRRYLQKLIQAEEGRINQLKHHGTG